ncbi:MAG: molybdopterin molybdotransferase MoeA [Campylobacterota bacterium]
MKKLHYVAFEEAQSKALEAAKPVKQTQILPLESAIGRVLAKDIHAIKDLPAFDNSAMDGFALYSGDENAVLQIAGTIKAGDKSRYTLPRGSAYKIMTGAKMPKGADAVVPFENAVDFDEQTVRVGAVKNGANFRPKGEELRCGEPVLARGMKLSWPRITMLAAQGITHVSVYRPLKIALLSTGNELREPWENADADEIYNCNSFGLLALLQQAGFEADYIQTIPDDLDESVAFIKGLQRYDVIITTGGISMGEADFIKEAFDENGLDTLFHGINIKPGKPTMMGVMEDSFVISLPGNPLSALVNTLVLVLPILRKISGDHAFASDSIQAQNVQSFACKPNRVNVVLGHLEDSRFRVTGGNSYGSGMITPLMQSNAVMITTADTKEVKKDQVIAVIPFYFQEKNNG